MTLGFLISDLIQTQPIYSSFSLNKLHYLSEIKKMGNSGLKLIDESWRGSDLRTFHLYYETFCTLSVCSCLLISTLMNVIPLNSLFPGLNYNFSCFMFCSFLNNGFQLSCLSSPLWIYLGKPPKKLFFKWPVRKRQKQ